MNPAGRPGKLSSQNALEHQQGPRDENTLMGGLYPQVVLQWQVPERKDQGTRR